MTLRQSEDASRQLIESDLRFAMALLTGATASREGAESVDWLVLSHLQHLSLVAYEVRKFSRVADESAVDTWAHDLALAASRHSTKLFNDTQKSHLELLADFTESAASDRSWFLQTNRAPGLVRILVRLGFPINDTSVLLYGGRLLCTSQSINFHAGLRPGADGAETRDRASELASYLSGLCGAVSEAWSGDDYLRFWRTNDAVAWDAQYEKLYRAMFPALPLAEGIALSAVRADLFLLQLMRELVPASDPLAPATFKFRFAGVWQIIETLRAIAKPGTTFNLTAQMRNDLDVLLGSDHLAVMRTSGARSLRNVLVHYGLGRLDPARLNWLDPLLGLPELLLEGRSWGAVDQIVEQQIARLSDLIDSWAESFERTLDEPH
jgi:hypothetical protein